MPFAVGFASQYRNGKDTAADYLQPKLNEIGLGTWKRGSLGSNVKKIFAEHFNVSLEFIEEWKVKQEPPPGFAGLLRDGLTKIGDGWRDTKPDIWIRKLFENNDDNLVVSDVRYINESQAIRGNSDLPYMKHIGLTVLMWRPGFENNKPSRSEQEIMPFVNKLKEKHSGIITDPDIPFDIWLRNNGTVEELHTKIDKIVLPEVIKKFSEVFSCCC
jgi:hypothetical protein